MLKYEQVKTQKVAHHLVFLSFELRETDYKRETRTLENLETNICTNIPLYVYYHLIKCQMRKSIVALVEYKIYKA